MIRLVNAKKVYKGDGTGAAAVALDGISMEIENGEFVAVMGKSGSGKTTLLNVLGCLDKLTEGKYYLDDVDISSLGMFRLDKVRKEKISFIFQNYELMDNYTVYENIELPLLAHKVSSRERRKKVNAIMEQLGIRELGKKYPGQISGGEQQRTAIARALVADNEYILADEPTGALDEENSRELMNILKDIHETGKTIIMVTHDKDIAEYADRIIEIADGRITDSQN